MKRVLFLFLFALLASAAQAQTCMTFQEFSPDGKKMERLDSLYPKALATDSTARAFPASRQKEFEIAWTGFYEELMKYFTANGLFWGKSTDCFNKVYFSAEGKVDYWLFNFLKKDQVPQETQDLYLKLITQYSQTHGINFKADKPFAQCATVTFFDFTSGTKRKKDE